MENKVIYITQAWELTRKDNTLYFENITTKKVIPVIWIEQIYCLWEVSINSKLLQFLTENKIAVHFFNYHGYYAGTYSPRESYISGKLLINQVHYYTDLDKRLEIARLIVEWIADNAIYILTHYQNHGKNVAKYIKQIKDSVVGIKLRKEINELLFVEWMIWDSFYSSFKEFLREDFVLNKRVRRPPDNPINAMISFGNSVLYSYVLTKIYHTQLNPTISYLHEPFQRRFSLALDLAELFKMWLVFGNIFNLVNKWIIQVEKHFIQDVNYSVLNNEWRKLFLQYWDERISKTVDHPILKRKTSNGSMIKLECYKLIKHIMWEQLYQPFNLKNWY